MKRDRKKGQLKLEGDKPMEFVESDDGPIADWTPEQENASRVVSQAIKEYIKNAENLAKEKYGHLHEKIPVYLKEFGNVLIAICSDGIVIRYERKSDEKSKLAVSVMQEGFSSIASMLSQNLVHIQSPEFPVPPDENFGIELKMAVGSPSRGTYNEISASRIWFQVDNIKPEKPLQHGAKPYCLLSVRNQLEFELHGEMIADKGSKESSQPFIARSKMRMNIGWECIEVFPGLNLEEWNSDFAANWAEQDILGAILVAQTQEAQLNSLDPRASARRQYAKILGEFKELLDSNPEREQILQSFLQKYPVLLCPTHTRMWPKLPLGATITDFVFCESNQEYLLVELERSTLSLFRQDGHPTADLTHAQGQIIDWKRYLEDNLQTVQRELGLTGITPNPNGLLVIGRTKLLSPENRRKLQTMTNESPKLRIMTYDDVYDNAKAVLENLLGPIWDTGGSTQIFYPSM